MDERIFDQLDQLQRGARELVPRQQGNNYSSAGYSDYGEADAYHDDCGTYFDEGERFANENVDLMVYSRAHSQMPHTGYLPRHGAMNGTQGASWPSRPDTDRQAGNVTATTRSLDLSRFALGDGAASSSPGIEQPQHSSPVSRASQRRLQLADVARPAFHRRPIEHPARYTQPQQSGLDPFEPAALRPEINRPSSTHQSEAIQPAHSRTHSTSKQRQDPNGRPIVQGISLISTHDLPDRFRSIFPFPLFNAVQSKCFSLIYETNDNFVLSSPTGSGKTAILELAICRLMNGFRNGTYKIVYQAPTKSLCSERQKDWQAKFGPLDLQVAELTGDTDNTQLRNVQHASIIITTPEKWDSMTRKWKDHQKLMQMVKLFLIDEVHILKEDRGATLEAIVSRMKSFGSDLRFVALSATVPNSQDIAIWLGKNSVTSHLPAPRERFGEEFRPVRLTKHVCGYQASGNDFVFEKTLNAKLPDVIAKWSQRKPIMVFCFTRNSCTDTAKLLSNWWATRSLRDRFWEAPRRRLTVEDKDLRDTVSSGVAFHHAGLSIVDRNTVEKGYLDGDINVICCTSTLAVGMNLPCHMVIIKNTVTYQSNSSTGCKEYSDLEIMQMLGRAGRPQFDNSAVAVIMTRLQMVSHYEKMVTGQENLESCLHRNLIDHLNAEIGLGTIHNASSAKNWLSGTFLYVRLKENPEHYRIDGDASGRNLDERLENICSKAIVLLEEHDLVQKAPKLRCTEFGDAMARYYIRFDTMKNLLCLPPQAKTSEILSAIAQAAEFKEVRFRAGEKPTYKELNKNSGIKFPIPVNLDAPAHKVSLVIQAVLGAVDFPSQDYKQKMDFNTSKGIIFQNVHRLIRCVVDCQLYLDDSVTTRNALALARSLGAQVWDDSPLHMKQIEGVGLVSVRKLATAGIRTIEDLENAEQHRLEQILSRNPPYGGQLQQKARAFPRLRVSLKLVGEPITKPGEHVHVKVCAEIGFLNEKVPELFQRKLVYVCLLVEISDGQVLHFARISAKKLSKGQDIPFAAHLTQSSQAIRAYVMCVDIAGTLRHAMLKPDIPLSAFPAPQTTAQANKKVIHAPNTAKRRAEAAPKRKHLPDEYHEFGDAGIDDSDLVLAEDNGFANIDDFDNEGQTGTKGQKKPAKQPKRNQSTPVTDWEPRQLDNGKWACNHACKDKTSCKHLCCREGLDKKPKPPKLKEPKKQSEPSSDPRQTQLSMSVKKSTATAATQPLQNDGPGTNGRTGKTQASKPKGKEIQSLDRLHERVKSNTRPVPLLGAAKHAQASTNASSGPGSARFGGTQGRHQHYAHGSSDYGDIDDFEATEEPAPSRTTTRISPPALPSDNMFADNVEDMLDDGFDDFQDHLPNDFEHQPMDVDFVTNNYVANQRDNDNTQPGFLGDPASNHAGMHPAPVIARLTGGAPMKMRQPTHEASSDSAAMDLGVAPYGSKRSVPPDTDAEHFEHSKRARGAYHSSDEAPAHAGTATTEAELPIFTQKSILDDVYFRPEPEELHEAKQASSEDPSQWFAREIGLDGFNYVG